MITASSLLRTSDPVAIRAALDGLPSQTPLRARDAAARIGVSEAELVAADVGTASDTRVVRLRDEPAKILQRVPELGTVLALTRNEAAVHEKIGRYGQIEGDDQVAGIYGADIELRLFFRHWRFGFAFDNEVSGKRSLPGRRSRSRR